MLLRELLNRTGEGKAAVVGWGRGMGHKGHMMLASSVITQANETGADPYFVVSRTVGKDDPITPDEKMDIYKKVFPKHGHIFHTATDEMPDLTRVLTKLAEHNYTDVTVVVGADQVKALSYVKNYNGKPDKAGNVPYNFNTLNVIARQETNDPSREEEGPRATPMRSVLMDPKASEEEKFKAWRDAMSPELSDDEVRELMAKAQARMSDPAFGKKEKVKEGDLMEGPELASTLKHIVDNGKYITQVYDNLKHMAKKFVDSRGDLKGFAMMAGGVGSRWYNDFYFNKLQTELYALTKQSSKYAADLHEFLKSSTEDRDRKISFTEISRSLPPILYKMGQRMGNKELSHFAASWNNRRQDYEAYLDQIEAEAGMDDDSGYYEPKVKPERDHTLGKQNAQVEQLVSDILNKLPKHIAGDIRNAIARKPNKLQALQQELQSRKIPMDESLMSLLVKTKTPVKKTSSAEEMRKYFEKDKAKDTNKVERGHVDKTAQQVYTRHDEEAAGVGIVTKQNTTADVGPGTLGKMLKAFKL